MIADPKDDDDEARCFASPPCYLHEIDPAWLGLTQEPAAPSRAEILGWRKAERRRLIAKRLALPADQRTASSALIAAGLDALIDQVRGRTISVYWTFKGEPELRRWMERVHARGGRCALPVVVERARPLVFREWQPGARLERGIWNIPVPADGGEVVPDIVVAPVVGFDAGCWRLGYGGGYYDRTLAALAPKPRIVGVGHSSAAIPTIHPLPHDIPMDVIVTEHGIVRPEGARDRP